MSPLCSALGKRPAAEQGLVFGHSLDIGCLDTNSQPASRSRFELATRDRCAAEKKGLVFLLRFLLLQNGSSRMLSLFARVVVQLP